MIRLWALAHNTFREAVRDKVLYSILFFAVGVIALSLVMQEITVGDREGREKRCSGGRGRLRVHHLDVLGHQPGLEGGRA